MPGQLDRYNRLRYHNGFSTRDEFIDFLYEKSEITVPEVDENAAWDRIVSALKSPSKRVDRPSKTKKINRWLKVAAAVIFVLGAGFFAQQFVLSPKDLTISSKDNKINVTFPDGSKGVLNKHSTFVFREKFGEIRLVRLIGEGYFDVRKSQKPFVVNVGDVQVKVIGTAFNLINIGENIQLYVERGVVAFEKDGVQTKVPAGLKAVFNKINKKIVIEESPPGNIMSWRDGVFEFEDVPLKAALPKLASFYNFNFKFQNNKIGECKITASFNKQPLSEVISTLESILDIKFTRKGNLITLSGRGC